MIADLAPRFLIRWSDGFDVRQCAVRRWWYVPIHALSAIHEVSFPIRSIDNLCLRCTAGDSDLCARFRCVSCQYTFRPTSTHKQGSIGRVFVTHQVRKDAPSCVYRDMSCDHSEPVSCKLLHCARLYSIFLVQPEACNSISEASTTMFHRAREAKECALRSMCTMPLWVPEITKNAPMAVMEILQPEYQTDFDFLHEVVRPWH